MDKHSITQLGFELIYDTERKLVYTKGLVVLTIIRSTTRVSYTITKRHMSCKIASGYNLDIQWLEAVDKALNHKGVIL